MRGTRGLYLQHPLRTQRYMESSSRANMRVRPARSYLFTPKCATALLRRILALLTFLFSRLLCVYCHFIDKKTFCFFPTFDCRNKPTRFSSTTCPRFTLRTTILRGYFRSFQRGKVEGQCEFGGLYSYVTMILRVQNFPSAGSFEMLVTLIGSRLMTLARSNRSTPTALCALRLVIKIVRRIFLSLGPGSNGIQSTPTRRALLFS